MRFEEVLRRLEPLPDALPEGPPALMPMVLGAGGPRPRAGWDAPSSSARPAGVLVLLFPDGAGDARLVLTERADRGGHHSGEVSFPGGRAEPGDADIVATALREAAEEVGLDPAECEARVLGTLTTQWIPVSNFTVTPVVAVARRRPTMRPQPAEVAAIVEAPVGAFLPDAPLLHVEREMRGFRLSYAAYPIDGLVIWGMTARVLGGLGAHLGRDVQAR
jgi:8-oxo-dGTP pyrophosphatase MutT (NUDIX family)